MIFHGFSWFSLIFAKMLAILIWGWVSIRLWTSNIQFGTRGTALTGATFGGTRRDPDIPGSSPLEGSIPNIRSRLSNRSIALRFREAVQIHSEPIRPPPKPGTFRDFRGKHLGNFFRDQNAATDVISWHSMTPTGSYGCRKPTISDLESRFPLDQPPNEPGPQNINQISRKICITTLVIFFSSK